MTRWRNRIGPEEMELLLSETLETAKHGGKLTEQHMERVNVDTTVQEQAIALEQLRLSPIRFEFVPRPKGSSLGFLG